MGKFDVFEIELAKEGPFLSGSVVSGDVLLKSKKERALSRVMIHLYGGGRVAFVDPQIQKGSQQAKEPAYQDSQTYLSQTQVLLERQSLAKNQLHRLNFALRLPERLPSSYMTVVTYSLTALLERGASGKNCTLTRQLVVIADVDLNSLAKPEQNLDELWQPIDAWGHWCSKSTQQQQQKDAMSLVTARLQTDKRGFAIGESIRLSLEVRNNTKARLDFVRVCLTQKAVFEASSATASGAIARREQRLAVQHSRLQERLKPGASLLENDFQLPVPWVATGDSAQCRLVRISYWLQVVCAAVTPPLAPVANLEQPIQMLYMGPKFDKSEKVLVLLEEPVTIGTRPLVPETAATVPVRPSVVPPPRPPPPQLAVPSAPEFLQQDMAMFTMAPSAPPSYEESMMQHLRDADAASAATTNDGWCGTGK